jgi:hypothetical protein
MNQETHKNGGCIYRDRLTRGFAADTTVLAYYMQNHSHFTAEIWSLRIRSGEIF